MLSSEEIFKIHAFYNIVLIYETYVLFLTKQI